MTYDLYIGDRTFSSWSLRGWLMFEKFDLPFRTHLLGLYSGTLKADLSSLSPARTVPVAVTPEGSILTDSIAIAETLVENHPDKPFYPSNPKARGLARSMVAEMHSGFLALREACPMMLAHSWEEADLPPAVIADVKRIEELWQAARDLRTTDGPWLFGSFSLADAFYAPVATRFATYAVPVGPTADIYVRTVLADPAFRRWRAMGQTVTYDPMPYRIAANPVGWPGPKPLPAEPIESGDPINMTCPFSGKAITHLAKIDGSILGFCNAFCRDKTVFDPMAWTNVAAFLDAR